MVTQKPGGGDLWAGGKGTPWGGHRATAPRKVVLCLGFPEGLGRRSRDPSVVAGTPHTSLQLHAQLQI